MRTFAAGRRMCRARQRRVWHGAAVPFTALGMALSAAPALHACPVCFGGASGGGQGMNAAIFFLLAIVAVVQVGFVALFWSFRRRAQALRRKRESFQLLEGGVR